MTFCLQELCKRHHSHNWRYLQEWLFFFVDNILYLTLVTCYLQVVYVLYFNLSSAYCNIWRALQTEHKFHIWRTRTPVQRFCDKQHSIMRLHSTCCDPDVLWQFFYRVAGKVLPKGLGVQLWQWLQCIWFINKFLLFFASLYADVQELVRALAHAQVYSYNPHLGVQKCDELGKSRLYIILWVHCLTLSSRWLQIGDCPSIDLSYNWAAI